MKVRIKKVSGIFPESALYETTILLQNHSFSFDMKAGRCHYKSKYAGSVKNLVGVDEDYFSVAIGGGYNICVRKEWVDIL